MDTGVVIGMDPHKRTVTIEVMDAQEHVLGHEQFTTDADGFGQMLAYAQTWPERVWAIEGCAGIGRHVAERLVLAGEQVVDVPAKLSARMRMFATGQGRKTDDTDAHSIALVGVRISGLHPVVTDAQLEVLRLLVDRRRRIGDEHVMKVCQLHRILLELIPGGAKTSLSAAQARKLLAAVDGQVSITAASLVGKMFYLFRTLLESDGVAIDSLDDLDFESPAVQTKFKDLYLRNALPPIPVLVRVAGSSYEGAIYVSLDPGYFVGDAAQDLLEGSHRVLGTVRHIVADGDDGYLATDPWLLAGWEHLLRRLLMAHLGDQVQSLTSELDIKPPEDDAYGWIKGPAVVLDAVAIY
ncbi:IS110 family transposase [Piscicoccus intestinalis]|uniref:IS110 family transposase n=1 Tax=Piscicoccus intestinalis TaxID=746033 RepID=UPI001FE09A55|nr:transposase [Piscicoccus intestinalis]